MARKSTPEANPSATRNGASVVRYAIGTAVFVIGVGALAFTAARVDQFLVTDSRLMLPALPDGATSGPNFRVYGLNHAPEEKVIDVFARDFQRSLYLCPIADRRLKLMSIDWVKNASVSRVWPNSLVIRIEERTPVAFAHLAGSSRIALIDVDGVLMAPNRNIADFNVPVLTGVSSKDTLADRRERVSRYLKLKNDLGPAMDQISEVDVSDVENLAVTQQFGDHAYTLMLGNKDYLKRLTNFTANYQEIRKKMPQEASQLDLRMPDRVIFVPVSGGKPNGK